MIICLMPSYMAIINGLVSIGPQRTRMFDEIVVVFDCYAFFFLEVCATGPIFFSSSDFYVSVFLNLDSDIL
jgi:hypothetical protein